MYKTFERRGKFTAQAIGLKELPVVKVGTIAQAEACQKVIAIQCHRLGEWFQASWTYLRCRVTMCTALRQPIREDLNIYPEISTMIQANGLPINIQPGIIQSFVERGKRPAQGSACMRLIIFRPEQICQRIATLALPGNSKISN